MIHWHTHTSKAIANFPMGDNATRTLPIYTPPDYDAKRATPYPVIFLLAGFGSFSAKYVWEESAFQPSLTSLFDKAINNNDLPPFIGVFPDGTSKLGCSQYINSPVLGHYQDYIADELTAFVDSHYHTHSDKKFRGIAGHSSGGFGALVMGMQRPDKFLSICSSAGDSFYEVSLLPLVNYCVDSLEKCGGPANFIQQFLNANDISSLGQSAFMTMLAIAMAPCFAPNSNNSPLFGDLFFDLNTGAIIDDIWQKYLAWDPLRMVDNYVPALKTLQWIHLAAGLQDEHGLQLGHRQISAKLKLYNIPHQLEEYSGRHSGHTWRFVQRVDLMLKNMFG